MTPRTQTAALSELLCDLPAAPAAQSPTTAADLEAARQRLPLDDPDRHALDIDVDRQFAEMAAKWGGAS